MTPIPAFPPLNVFLRLHAARLNGAPSLRTKMH